jgi:hypothetical protein
VVAAFLRLRQRARRRRVGTSRLRDRSRQPEAYQLWVGASVYGRTETILVAVMPYLNREAARHADSAWR